MSYTYAEHRFRFAAWAAARALIPNAISYPPAKTLPHAKRPGALRKELVQILRVIFFNQITPNDAWLLKISNYDQQHKKWREQICKLAKQNGIMYGNKNKIPGLSHGQAAKLINVFIKTLMPPNMNKISLKRKNLWCKIIHPPIDRIMLTEMDAQEFGGKKNWNKIPWTQLNSKEYQILIDDIRKNEPCLWKIERFWTP